MTEWIPATHLRGHKLCRNDRQGTRAINYGVNIGRSLTLAALFRCNVTVPATAKRSGKLWQGGAELGFVIDSFTSFEDRY